MGYIAQPFAVDLNKVRKVLGSQDRAFLEKLKSSDFYENYASYSEEDEFDDVLQDLIVRYIKPDDRKETKGVFGLFKRKQASGLNAKRAHQYGYALIVICDALGIFLSPGGDIFYAGDFWKAANELFKSKGIKIDLDRMWKSEKLFDIPLIPDFPVISHYNKQEINYLLKELALIMNNDLNADNKNDASEGLHELLTTFKDGLQTCQDNDVEWVAFLH